MQNMGLHIDATLKSLPQGNDRYRNITAKVEGYYQKAVRLAGDAYSALRNQIIVAMNQGVVATNQINSQVEALRADYEGRIDPLSGELMQIRQQCHSGYMSTEAECDRLEEAGKVYEQKARDLIAALTQLDKTYQTEIASQQAMIDKAENIP